MAGTRTSGRFAEPVLEISSAKKYVVLGACPVNILDGVPNHGALGMVFFKLKDVQNAMIGYNPDIVLPSLNLLEKEKQKATVARRQLKKAGWSAEDLRGLSYEELMEKQGYTPPRVKRVNDANEKVDYKPTPPPPPSNPVANLRTSLSNKCHGCGREL